MTKLKCVALIFILLVIGQGREFASPRVFTPLNGAQDAPTSPVSFWKGSEAFVKSPLLVDRMAATRYTLSIVTGLEQSSTTRSTPISSWSWKAQRRS